MLVKGILKGKGNVGFDANLTVGPRFAANLRTEPDEDDDRPKFRTFSPVPSSGDESE